MNLRTAILGSALLFLAMPVLAREHTDVIVMKNGDRLTGEVKGIEAGVLYIDLDYVDGTMPLDWSKVTHLESSQRFIVSTQDGSVYSGTLNSIQIPFRTDSRGSSRGDCGRGSDTGGI
jgi:small nuclear ribonucleoprotein (snRNP)-like protein